ncbi:BREX system Lon protease-like protein BrxL, partial [bacterium]|nr:BREX system Lon protease-like protein BrxL [bacterium]
ITDYLAEAFHYQLKHTNRYEEVSQRINLGKCVEGRDEKGIKKTVAAFLKMLHPHGECSDEDFEEYVVYAIEGRRRVKEQMNKRKPDDEFINIGLSFFNADDKEIVVNCPETIGAEATLNPIKPGITADAPEQGESHNSESTSASQSTTEQKDAAVIVPVVAEATSPELKEQHYTITYDSTGYSYESIIVPYLTGATSVVLEDPYIRATHQVQNFIRFCEAVLKQPTVKKIQLITSYDNQTNVQELAERLQDVKQSLLELDVELDIKVNENLHDREIRIDNDWIVKIGRGLDFFQRPDNWFSVGANDLGLRKCLETKVDIYRRS